jgi:hypothetical protein
MNNAFLLDIYYLFLYHYTIIIINEKEKNIIHIGIFPYYDCLRAGNSQ